jgi:hypothetical protein
MTVKTRCVTNIKKHMGEAVSREQVEAAVDAVFDMAQRDPDLTRSMAQKLKLSARKLSEQEILAAKQERLRRAIDVLRYQERKADAELRISRGTARRNVLDYMIGGSVRGIYKAGDSTDAVAKARWQGWMGGLRMEVRHAGLLEYVTGKGLIRRADPVFDRDLAVEMRIANGGKDTPTGNAQAASLAKIYNKYMELGRVTLNKAGAGIAKAEGYITAQTHDAPKIGRAGFEVWRDAISKELDERTFTNLGITNKEEFFKSSWTNLATGNHQRPENRFAGQWKGAGPGNLARRLSEGRVFIFKDADAWVRYNEKFGVGTVQDGVFDAIKNAARSSVVMEQWGTNPMAMMERIANEQIEKAKNERDIKAVARLETALSGRVGMTPSIRHLFEAATGLDDAVGNPNQARIWATTRNVVASAKLGGMSLSQFGDIATRASVMRHNGINMLEGVADGMTALFKGRGGPVLQDMTDMMGVGVDGFANEITARMAGVDSVPGIGTKLMAGIFRLTGSKYMADTWESRLGLMLSNNLARLDKLSYDMLPERLRTNFLRYGIEATEWDSIRGASKMVEDGHRYIFSHDLVDQKLSDRLSLYFIDQANEGMTKGGAAERAWVTQFGPAGSWPGELARFMLQFKSFSMTFARRHIGREFVRSGVDFMGVAQLIAWSSLTGYISMSAKDLAKGREPRDPSRPDTWSAAFLQGGGMGIYGDYLLAEYNRFGQTLGQTAMGPTASLVSDWGSIFAKIASGGLGEAGITGLGKEQDWGKIGVQAMRTASNTTPFMNLFYTRVALDYAILYNVQEALDPGAMHRLERRLKKENDQEFLVKPSSVVR